MHLAMQGVFLALLRMQCGDDLFDLLAARLVRDQHRVRGFHHNKILYTDQGYQAACRMNQAITAVRGEHISCTGVACLIFRQHTPHRIPRTQVAPARI